MDWTVGTFWTMGKDALDTGDRLWTAWTPGTAYYYLAALGRSGIILPHSGRSAESAKHTSPGQAAPKARAALGSASSTLVFLGLFGSSRRS